ncbi:hypothetical protein [Lutimonas zeaxanthinifaciens]|uniref:hypothetical protein n=1 Tax=Lutimonas zeaxanthinifaciens TaxID=3060215 RepID=UPI00265CB1BB|nr:hypothetical protein [Lutimonas sp. YSD2104]WKK67426.1 hypothetical protein QZH61_07300 [Lutimonas sp. YSD2104]
MKNSIYFSATLGIVFLSIRFAGLFIDLTYNDLFLIIGSGILVFVTLPLYIVEQKKYFKKKQSILKTFKKESQTVKAKDKKKQSTDYPSFRKQKSGLTWGGGNIHGSVAKRGSKRGFLKH